MKCPFQVREELLPQVEEFRYLRVLFTNEGRVVLYRSVVVKREQSIDLLMSLRLRSSKRLNKFWVVTERMKLLGMSFPLPVAPHRKRKERERG